MRRLFGGAGGCTAAAGTPATTSLMESPRGTSRPGDGEVATPGAHAATHAPSTGSRARARRIYLARFVVITTAPFFPRSPYVRTAVGPFTI
jgi:hypothetical protein